MPSSYLKYIMDLLSPYGDISSRAMFGGYGIYKNKIIIAIIANDELYFKVDSSNKAQYEELNSEPFMYDAKGKKVAMSYWKVPLEILEDESELGLWIEQSYQISLKKYCKNTSHPLIYATSPNPNAPND